MNQNSRVQAICPICGAPSKTAFIVTCEQCGHGWLGSPAENDHRSDYKGYRTDPVFAENVRRFIRTDLSKIVPPPARILDVGCGAGEFIVAAEEAGYDALGIDISADGVAFARERGGNAKVANFLEDDLGGYDLITMWDVMEHLLDPDAFVKRAHEVLKPGGVLFAKIPYFGPLSILMSRKIPRVSGPLLGAPSHVQFYSARSLRRLFEERGFDPSFEKGPGVRSGISGGGAMKQGKRLAIRATKSLSGDGNFYLFARAPKLSEPAAAERSSDPPQARTPL